MARLYARPLARPPENYGGERGSQSYVVSISSDLRPSCVARRACRAGKRSRTAVPNPRRMRIGGFRHGYVNRLAHLAVACEGKGSSELMVPASSAAVGCGARKGEGL